MRNFVVYVPGLADKTHYVIGQRTALFFWRSRKLQPYYFVPDWVNKQETFEQKLGRLLHVIDAAHARGFAVSLVAASAGSPLALVAFYKRRAIIEHAVSICGKLRRPQSVPTALLALNPAFDDAIAAFARIEPKLSDHDRKKILIVSATRDSYVPKGDGALTYAHTHVIRSSGHVFSIMMALTWHKLPIIRFITG